MPLQAVVKDVERHQDWLEVHEERIRSLELSRAKFVGMMIACSFIGSAAGSLIVLFLSKYLGK